MQKIDKIFSTLFKGVDFANKALLCVAAIGFSGICFAQVFCRYVLNNSIVWADQACRYLFCVSTFLGAALCVNEKKHTSIDILAELLPEKGKKIQTIVIYLIIAVFGIVLAKSGAHLAAKAMKQKVTTLPLSMGVIYEMIPISAVLITINGFRVAFRELQDLLRKEDKNGEVS